MHKSGYGSTDLQACRQCRLCHTRLPVSGGRPILSIHINSTSTKSPSVPAFIRSYVRSRFDGSSDLKKLPLSSLRSFWADSTTAMQYWSVCPNPSLYHFSGHRMQRLDWNSYAGYRYISALTTNSVCSVLMNQIHNSRAPSYLTNIVTQTATVSSRSRLRSGSSARYEQPWMRLKLGQWAFSGSLEQSATVVTTDDQHRFFQATFEDIFIRRFNLVFVNFIHFNFLFLIFGFLLFLHC